MHNKIGELGIRPYEVTSELPIVFYNSIPSNAGDIGRDQCILLVDEVGFCFLNLEGSSDLVKSAYGIQLVNRFGDLITVDLFNVAQCKWTKSYTCPDVGLPDSRLQLLVADNDFIYIRYTGDSYNNIIQLNKNFVEQQRFQPNKNGYPQMLLGLDATGNIIVARKFLTGRLNHVG